VRDPKVTELEPNQSEASKPEFKDDKDRLKRLSIKKNVYYTGRRIIDDVRGAVGKEGMFCKVVDTAFRIRSESWQTVLKENPPDLWTNGWRQVLDDVYSILVKYPTQDKDSGNKDSTKGEANISNLIHKTLFQRELKATIWDGLRSGKTPKCPSPEAPVPATSAAQTNKPEEPQKK